MRVLKLPLLSILIALALLLSATRNGSAPSAPRPEKDETTIAIGPDQTYQQNQSALYGALIKALQAITSQEEETAKQTRSENESKLSPLRTQYGILFVTIAYVIVAFAQWRAIYRQGNIAQRTLDIVERPYLSVQIKAVHFEDADKMERTRLRVDYSLINSGRTPARSIDHNVVLCRTSSKERPQEPTYDPNAQQRVMGQTISPDCQHEAYAWLEF